MSMDLPIIREQTAGIYIHVPFCTAKCPYCNFYSVKADEVLMDAYTGQICRALENSARRWPRQADTLYFGGGTPILLGARRIGVILGWSTPKLHWRPIRLLRWSRPCRNCMLPGSTGFLLACSRQTGWNSSD